MADIPVVPEAEFRAVEQTVNGSGIGRWVVLYCEYGDELEVAAGPFLNQRLAEAMAKGLNAS